MNTTLPANMIVYLNGRFVPAPEAQISVFDRGFLFGDGVYEVLPAYGGRLFRLLPHLHRLDQSLAAVGMTPPLTHTQWTHVLSELVTRNGGGNLSVYLQVTRGVALRDHSFPPNTPATIMAYATPLQAPASSTLEDGLAAVTVTDERWSRCHIKSISLIANVLARQRARDAGAYEAILVRDNWVMEGAASNVFIVEQDELVTPPQGPHLLSGVTRELLLELAQQHHIPCREQNVSIQQLRQAQEIWLTSSSREVLPVTVLDGTPVGRGKPGPVFRHMLGLLQSFKKQAAHSES